MRKDIPFKLLLIGIALVVGLVYSALPHFVRYKTLESIGERYIPLTVQQPDFDHMNTYAPRYRDLVDGTLVPGEMDTYEHKGGPILFPILSAALLFPFFAPFDSVFPGFMITDFIFPIFLFLSLFLVFSALTQNRLFSLFSAFVLMLFPQLPVLIPPSSLTELKILLFQFIPFSDTATARLAFLTRDSFIPAGPFLVLMFYFVYRALAGAERKKTLVFLGGLFYGLLFYLYFFHWVFATIFLGILFLVLLTARRIDSVRTVFYIGLVGVLVSVPFWIDQYYLKQLPSYVDIVNRMGIEDGRGIRWFLWKTYLLFFAMAGLSLWVGKKFSKPVLGYFLAALALTGVIAYNANVLVGWTLQSDHWGNKVFLLTNGVIWAPLTYYLWIFLIERFDKDGVLRKISAACAVIIAILLTAHVVESEFSNNKQHARLYTVPASLMDAYEWFNENTPEDSVVMTPSIETNIELGTYTHNRMFQARAQNNLLSRQEVLERMYMAHAMFGVPPETFTRVLTSHLGVFNFFTAEYNSRAIDSSLRPEKYPIYELPPDVAQNVVNEYNSFKMPEKIPYRLDYLFIGPRERDIGVHTGIPEKYNLVYQKDGIEIYQIAI